MKMIVLASNTDILSAFVNIYCLKDISPFSKVLLLF
mgnify:CR=1 FL=1